MRKSLFALALIAAIPSARAETVTYEPVKVQIALDTAECMYDWIQGSLNRGARDRGQIVDSAVYMCSSMAFKFGWTEPEMTVLANRVFVMVPGVARN